MKAIIDLYKNVVIQIATPYSIGTGVYLKNHDLIVTNEHVVRDNHAVVINGEIFQKQLVKVLFIDPKHDLAFLEVPKNIDLPLVEMLADQEIIEEGDKILAIGHPFGLKYTTTQGIISNTQHMQSDIHYIQHDAALNPGNSGGPLVNESGHITGINTFIIKDGNSIGFSLPVRYLRETIKEYKTANGQGAVRCHSCSNIVFENTIDKSYCPHCGAEIQLPSQIEAYEAVGIGRTIEDLLIQLGHDIHLSRRGPNVWEIHKGSAKISITYYERNGMIVGDAFLCSLPKENIQNIYEYLLKQNCHLKGMTFSVKEQDIVLSLIIYDRYLNVDTGTKLFRYLFQKADDYDNILVEEYGALWKEE